MILTEHPLGCLFQDDEDKGSPSQDGVNPGEVMPGENRQISGSPSGAPSPVLSFPPNINFATTPREQSRG